MVLAAAYIISNQSVRPARHIPALVYVLVNTLLVVIWVMTDPHGFFWPVFPIAGWGIGVIMNAWDVYGRQEITEEDIHREMDRLAK